MDISKYLKFVFFIKIEVKIKTNESTRTYFSLVPNQVSLCSELSSDEIESEERREPLS